MNRVKWIDNLSGLLIINMIFFCHVRGAAVKINDGDILWHIQYFLIFFMPWFFFKSGMLHKNRTVNEEIKYEFNKLIIPWIKYSLIALIIQLLLNLIIKRNFNDTYDIITNQSIYLLKNGCIYWNIALWFLLDLFIVKIIYNIISKRINDIYISVISLLICFLLSISLKWIIPLYITTAFQGLFFYVLGKTLKNFQFKGKLFIPCLLLYILQYPLDLLTYWDSRSTSYNGNFFIVISILISGIVIFNNIFKKYFDREIPLLTYIGNNSLLIYVVHYPIIAILEYYIIPYLNLENTYIGFIFASIITIIVLTIIIRLTKELKKY